MEKCFVIQPFDNDKFDKRFVDIFEPAIKKAEFDAYRIDKVIIILVEIFVFINFNRFVFYSCLKLIILFLFGFLCVPLN